MIGSRVRFSESADRMALFPVWPNPRWWLGHHLQKFKWRYLYDGSSNLLRVWSAGRIALLWVGPNSITVREKTMREEWLDWSQSKVFFVYLWYFVINVVNWAFSLYIEAVVMIDIPWQGLWSVDDRLHGWFIKLPDKITWNMLHRW